MKERHVNIASPEIVRGMLSGKVSQLTIQMQPQPSHAQYYEWRGQVVYDGEHRMWCWRDLVLDSLWDFPDGEDRRVLAARCPYGVPGDRLWVRESWAVPGTIACSDDPVREGMRVVYRTDAPEGVFSWRSLVHMPRWASRLELEINGVRVERVREITYYDIRARGLSCPEHDFEGGFCTSKCPALLREWERWWRKTHGDMSWESDPWLWVIEFRRVQP